MIVKDTPQYIEGHEVGYGNVIVVWDDEAEAERVGRVVGGEVKHSKPRFNEEHWDSFSIVILPD